MLRRDQLEGINAADRERVTKALNHLAGAKSLGNHIDSPAIRELEEALRARLAELDREDGAHKVSKVVDGAMAIINGEVQPDPGAPIDTKS
jgi:hypothetical protein